MAHLEVETKGIHSRVKVDGQEVQDVIGLDLKFSVDAIAEATIKTFVNTEFYWSGPAMVKMEPSPMMSEELQHAWSLIEDLATFIGYDGNFITTASPNHLDRASAALKWVEKSRRIMRVTNQIR